MKAPNLNEVWFVLPTANAENCAKNLPLWRDMGYKIAVLQDRVRFDVEADRVVYADQYPGWPGTVNQLFREVIPETCDVFVAAGDDMRPEPNIPASELAEQFFDHFGGTFGIMQPHGDDFEHTKEFCGSPWIGRAWAERMYRGSGGMCDAYTHHWADDELFWISTCMGRLWSRSDIAQYHDHFRRNGEPMPNYWRESVLAQDERDTLTFIARAASGFPGHEPLWPSTEEPAPAFDRDIFRVRYKGRGDDYWKMFYGRSDTRQEADRLLEEALRSCVELGDRRIAVFGAGQHTRKAGNALAFTNAEIIAIVDDNPALIGQRMWNFPIVTMKEALALELDALILSSDAHETRLREAAEPLQQNGVRIVGLYTPDTAVQTEHKLETAE
ncbi:MAG: hypothetical protein AAGB34_04060 [Planctomycetota bacterium]